MLYVLSGGAIAWGMWIIPELVPNSLAMKICLGPEG